jgi:hypothetical protein
MEIPYRSVGVKYGTAKLQYLVGGFKHDFYSP